MITRITKENRAKYVQFFAKAAEALKDSGFGEDFSITTLEEYFQHIEQLAILEPSFVRLPLDEEVFEIDLNTRQINIPASFKKSGLGIQGDHLAETIYFKVDRYFDITDLATTFIVIQWETPNGIKMASPACFTDVSSENGKLIFGWGITKTMTEQKGTLKFSVAFLDGEQIIESLTSKEEELNISGLTYRLGTLTSSINVNQGLDIYSNQKVIFENSIEALKSRIKNSPIVGKIENAVTAAILGIEDNVTKYFDWKETKVFADIRKDLVTIKDKKAEGREDNGLTMIAVSENGAGIVSYEFFKDGKDDPIVKGQGAMRYVKVDYPKSRKIDAPIYFIDKTGMQESWRYFDENNDKWEDENDDTQVNPYLYERVAFCNIEEPGTYYAKVTLVEGKAVSVLDTREDLGVVAIIPAPTEIDNVSITSITDIFTEKPVEISSNIVLKVEEGETPYGEFKYQWCKRTYDENDSPIDTPIEGANSDKYAAVEIGNYVLHVSNWWNNAETDTKVSNNVIKIYLSAIKPEEVKLTATNPTATDNTNGAEVTSVGDDLNVTFKDIHQQEANQYVEWMISDNGLEDNNDISSGDWRWVYVLDEDGNPTEEHYRNNTLKALEPGDYKAIVVNYITDNNKQETDTSEEITATDTSWKDRIVRVYASTSNN